MLATLILVLIPFTITAEWTFYREKVVPGPGPYIFSHCGPDTGWTFYRQRHLIRILMFVVQPILIMLLWWFSAIIRSHP